MPTLTQNALDEDTRLRRQLDLLCVVYAICELAARALEVVASPVDLLEYVVDRGCEGDLSVTMAMTPEWLRPVTIVLPGRPQCDVRSLPAYTRCVVG